MYPISLARSKIQQIREKKKSYYEFHLKKQHFINNLKLINSFSYNNNNRSYNCT